VVVTWSKRIGSGSLRYFAEPAASTVVGGSTAAGLTPDVLTRQ
jgi:hypothetical protein